MWPPDERLQVPMRVVFSRRFSLPLCCLLAWLLTGSAVSALLAEESDTSSPPTGPVSYHTQIKPIFQAHCQGCHQPAKPQGQYVMTSFEGLVQGGESGEAAVVPGNPEASELLEQITPANGEALMPKGKAPLSPDQIALVRLWIEQGAQDDTPASAKVVYDSEHPPVYTQPPVVTSLDFSPDGELLAVAGHHEVLLHKGDGSEIVARLVGVSDRIESVRFSPDGKSLAVTGGAPARMGEVQVWDVATGTLKLSLQVGYDTVYGASWSPDGTRIAFGCPDNSLRVIEAESGKEVLFQGSHADWVLDTTFSVDGSHLASVGRDQTAKLTEFETQRFIDNITSITPGALKGGLAAVARHPERDEILVGGSDGVPRTYRMHRETKRVIGDDSNLVRELPALKGRIFSVAFSPDGKRLAAGSSLDGTGYLGIYSYEVDGSLPEELKKVLETVASQRKPEDREKVEAYHRENVSQLAQAEFAKNPVYALTFHPSGKQLAVSGDDGMIRLLDASDASTLQEFSAVPLTEEATPATGTDRQPWLFGSREEPVTEQLPAGTQVRELRVQPEEIVLTDPLHYTQLVVLATLDSGDVVDVTRLVQFKYPAELAGVDRFGLLQPRGDGTAVLAAQLADVRAEVPLRVSGQSQPISADYLQDVTPILSKLGCNQGTCHGSAQGKAGFKLSLRGYDPIFDVRALTDDHASRRTNVAAPEESLMLLKAIGGVPHVGGQLTTADHKYYEVLKTWITGGTELKLDSPRVASIDVFPKNPIIQLLDSRQQVRVVATFTDGSTRDVTGESFVESGNTEVAIINSSGLLTAVRRGEAPILARYEGAYAATTLTVMGDREGFVWQEPETFNRIDELVAQKWQRMKILPSELSTDAEFVRRVTFDLTGLPPTSDAVTTFLADPRPSREKREEYIDYLIGSDGYVEHFSNRWSDLLLANGKFLGREGAGLLREWIRKQISENKPYDEFVREILTASGSNKVNPPASYFKVLREPDETMENTTHLFLGIRFNCNKCHDHPFERWTENQYYETAAFFSQFTLARAPESGNNNIGGTAVEGQKPLYETVSDKPGGEIKHPQTNEVVQPVFPFGNDIPVPEEGTRREQLAAWMTSPENEYFARSYVNRLWGYLFGTGIIEPIDDIRAGNPPTNPELLDYLTAEFVDSGFDIRHIVRLICQSRTYQLSIVSHEWNEDDKTNFSHAQARRLTAEQLFDAIHLVTGAPSRIPGVPQGTRAAALGDSQIKIPDGFLNNFGRPTRESSCECERSNEVQLGPVMALVSGPTVASAIADPENALPTLVNEKADNRELVNELFLRVLNRPATEQEVAVALQAFEGHTEEHAELTQQLAAREEWWKPVKAQKEQERLQAIETAKNNLEAYQQEIAPTVAAQEEARQQKIAAAEQAVLDYEAALAEPFAKWLEQQRAGDVAWHYLTAEDLSASSGAEIQQLPDGSILAKKIDGQGHYEFFSNTRLENIRSIRIEALTHDSLPRKGPGLAPDGNFVLTEFTVQTADDSAETSPENSEKLPASHKEGWRTLPLHKARADFSQAGYDVATAIDGKIAPASNGWAVSPQGGKEHWAVFDLVEPFGSAAGNRLRFVMEQHFQGKQHWLGRFRVSVSTREEVDPTSPGQSQRLLELVRIEEADLTDEEREELLDLFKKQDAELAKKQAAVAEAKKPLPIDPRVTELQAELKQAEQPVLDDPALVRLRQDVENSAKLLENERLTAAQDITWALINSPAFLFNR